MISCKNLSLGHGKNKLTQPFNLEMPQHAWYGIIGENGSGKSTFLKTLLGLIKPSSGTIFVDAKLPQQKHDWISYIPQEREVMLGELTTAHDLLLATYKARQFGLPFYSQALKNKTEQLLTIVGAGHYAKQPFNTLSGGQKKRIYLAQALMNDPTLLLLDEPLADLDPIAKQKFLRALKAIHDQTKISLLIISHDMHEIANYLDGFIHFKKGGVHFCQDLPCIKESAYV